MSNDLISREWLEDAFDNLCCHNCEICRNFRIEDCFYKCALIDNAPTVEPERPKGEWVEPSGFNFDEFYGKVYKCTNCNAETLGCGCHNYCPNCGADMRGGAE